MLIDVECGKIQLPDFQRDWVWDDLHIRSLIASISLSYPIGAVMLLQTGGDAKFRARPIKGVQLQSDFEPEKLILDGQQRLTSLYLALKSGKPVKTRSEKGEVIERIYYLDMAKCLDPNEDRFDAVVSAPPSRQITSDFGRQIDFDISTPEREFDLGMFPLDAIFDESRYALWRRDHQKRFLDNNNRYDLFDKFESQIIGRFKRYRVPTITLLRDTPREAVCQVFEKVNTGGVTLTVFELVTATFAAADFNLRDDWEGRDGHGGRRDKLHGVEVLAGIEATDFLTCVTLYASYVRHKQTEIPISCKRRDVLRLTLDEYVIHADDVQRGLLNAGQLLARQKVFEAKNLPYQTQLTPLGAMCAALGDRVQQDTVRQKLARWYWCGVFGELYGGANESRFAFDVPEVIEWLEGGQEPRTVRDASFSPIRLLSMQTRLSAAYKGIIALLIQAGSWDFLSGDPLELTTYFDMAIDIHHIFPRAYCERQGFDRNQMNSIVNKAPLTAKTNRSLGGRAPRDYLISIEQSHGVVGSRLNEILRSHAMEPKLLRANDFGGFLQDRAIRLLDLIEQAMGKRISGRDSDEVKEAYGAPLVQGADYKA
ncbi:MAG: DUF262 domain-containing protein [Candidatus Poribacteria bacterium]|nr:DUF262 domain-containing protein [Candidatus Poribacteria bacterium]